MCIWMFYQTLDHFTNISITEIKLKEKGKTNANYNPMFLFLSLHSHRIRVSVFFFHWHSDPGVTLMWCTSLSYCHKCKTKLKKSWRRPVEHRNEKKGIKASWKVVNMVVGGSLAVLSVLQTSADLLGFSQHHSRRWGWQRKREKTSIEQQLCGGNALLMNSMDRLVGDQQWCYFIRYSVQSFQKDLWPMIL